MPAVLVQTLIDQTRVLSNLKNNQFYSDDDIGGFLTDAGKELADIFIAAYEHFFQASFNFTLAGGVGGNTVDLPADFQKANIILRAPASSNPERVPMLSNLLERSACDNAAGAGFGRRYFIGGDVLEMLPAPSAAGDYRLIYTPQFPDLWPTPPDFIAGVKTVAPLSLVTFGAPGPGRSFTVTPNPGAQVTLNGVPLVGSSSEDIATIVLIANQADPSQNGIFRCAESDPGGTVFYRLSAYDETSELRTGTLVQVTGGTVGRGIWRQTSTALDVDVDPLTFEAASLPQVLQPWQLFLKIHAAVAIRQGRQQPTADLVEKLNEQRARATKLAANRTEETTQAPMTRRRGWGWWGSSGGGNW